jgi:hypothetical protein
MFNGTDSKFFNWKKLFPIFLSLICMIFLPSAGFGETSPSLTVLYTGNAEGRIKPVTQ